MCSRASVYALAKRGPKVIYATDLTLDNLEELAKDVEKQYPGVQCIPRAVDAASTAGVTGIINEAMEKFGRLDVFFANAGVASGTLLQGEDEESFMRMMRINALRWAYTLLFKGWRTFYSLTEFPKALSWLLSMPVKLWRWQAKVERSDQAVQLFALHQVSFKKPSFALHL